MKLQTSGVLGTSYAIAKLAPKRGDKNLNEIATDVEFSMKIAMASFQNISENDYYKSFLSKVNDDTVIEISKGINGGGIGLHNRKIYSKKAYDEFNKN